MEPLAALVAIGAVLWALLAPQRAPAPLAQAPQQQPEPEGLTLPIQPEPPRPPATPIPANQASAPARKTPLQYAQDAVGKVFHGGVAAQCAAFIDRCFDLAGINLPIAQRPSDGWTAGELLANRFAGDEVGRRITRVQDLRAGDIVMFGGTYGGYSSDTITHVGIYEGNGMVIHRPTADGVVERDPISQWRYFVEGRRPNL